MTDVYLDNMSIDYENHDGTATVGDLVKAIDRELSALKRFVLEVAVNGEDHKGGWRESGMQSRKISDCSEVRLKTASLEDMARVGFETVREYISVVGENIDACVKGLRLGSSAGVDAVFVSIFDGIIEIVKTLDAITSGTARYKPGLFKKNPEVYYGALYQKLEILKNASGGGDTVLIADILDYELKPLLKEISEEVFH